MGLFPHGETPEGVSDMAGNVAQWTSSLFGRGHEGSFPYPYQAYDGREDPAAGSDVRRVLRGGLWYLDEVVARAVSRNDDRPDNRSRELGFRLARSVTSPISG